MHYFKSINYLVEPETISDIHIGNEGPNKDFFGNFKNDGKVSTTINFKDGRSISLVSSELSLEGKTQKVKEISEELIEYFDPKTEPKEAKEDPVERVLSAEEKNKTEDPV